MPDPAAAKARKERLEATKNRKLEALRKQKTRPALVGLGALAGIGAIATGAGLVRQRMQKDRTEAALMDFYDSQRRDALAQQVEQVKRQSLERSIDQNLRNVALFEPAIYTAVSAGRKLPQGAVVLGGEPRVDLLQELGRSMAEGQFRQ
jgi:molybdopterin synthase catalytic subunit